MAARHAAVDEQKDDGVRPKDARAAAAAADDDDAGRRHGSGRDDAGRNDDGVKREPDGDASRGRHLVRRVLPPLLVVAAGALVVFLLVRTRPTPTRAERPRQPNPVLVERISLGSGEVEVRAQGEVVAARDVRITPQVSGKVVWRHPQLEAGGIVEEGDLILRIDPSDYRLAVQTRKGELAQAELALEEARNRQAVAEESWERFDPEIEAPTPFALRVPQVETAEAEVKGARSRLRRARLDLRRTRIEAPFDATVVAEQVGLGETVSPQTMVAELVASDRFWVRTAVPVDKLGALNIPGVDGADEGSTAEVILETGQRQVVHPGRVLRVQSELDRRGQLARVLVVVEDPLGLDAEEPPGLPLLLGARVDVSLGARPLEDVARLPRVALHEGDTVWVAEPSSEDDDDPSAADAPGRPATLAIREVGVAWTSADQVWVDQGLDAGDRVVTSRLPTPVEGMALRIVPEEEAGPSIRYANRRPR
jgi:RND family efflux transporter MFP subunit